MGGGGRREAWMDTVESNGADFAAAVTPAGCCFASGVSSFPDCVEFCLGGGRGTFDTNIILC